MKKWKPYLKTLPGLLFFVLALWLLARHLQHYRFEEIWRALRDVSAPAIAVAIILVCMDFGVIIQLDVLGLHWLRKRLDVGRVALVSFLGNVFGRTIGFPVLTAGGLRYRFYQRWGFTVGQIGRLVGFQLAGFTLGFMAVTGIALMWRPVELPEAWPGGTFMLRMIGLSLVLLVLGYLLLGLWRKKPFVFFKQAIDVPGIWTALGQTGLSILKWILDGAILYVLLLAEVPIPIMTFAAIYFAAQSLSIVTHAPAGLGVFDASFIFLMKPYIPVPELVASLVLYRALYNLLPMLLAVPLYLGVEARLHLRR